MTDGERPNTAVVPSTGRKVAGKIMGKVTDIMSTITWIGIGLLAFFAMNYLFGIGILACVFIFAAIFVVCYLITSKVQTDTWTGNIMYKFTSLSL